ncbi:hypothetical protein NTD86_16545 [Pseudomonas sp. 7P_10.2_Bac1]|uniref:acetyl-CoA carboxylase biotin carboxyl carrier protein n=1 Tax=Pseudomonas sp. 7P_10.2_Bac1 TaxID=2971614 RepID=UPI0021C91400|nr:biotin/lipoyl-containing protein [Pseudomonas sp. 7P_10.2_Bac1]MCU1728594.1 hypothetical protein [Pseudomonas sp. 7P_10.2_Bac1]
MQSNELEKLIDSFERSTLVELKYSQGSTKVHLARRHPTTVQAVAPPLTSARAAVVPTLPPQPDEHTIVAPMSGIVYLRASPAKPDFTSIGSKVSEGDTLAVIEAMKLFNPVEAECACEIVEVLVVDGAEVERGTQIYRVRKLKDV